MATSVAASPLGTTAKPAVTTPALVDHPRRTRLAVPGASRPSRPGRPPEAR